MSIGNIQMLGAICTLCAKSGPGLQYDYNKYSFNGYNNAYAKRVQAAAEKLAEDHGWITFPNSQRDDANKYVNCKTHACPVCFDTISNGLKAKKKTEKAAAKQEVKPASIDEQVV